MYNSNIIPIVPKKINKLMQDIIKLQSFTTIKSIEIELEYTTPEIINYFTANEIAEIHNNTVIVDTESSNLNNVITLDEVLLEIYRITVEEEIIDGILANVTMQIGNRWINASIEIDGISNIPKLISIDNQAIYYDFINLLKYKWYSS